MDTSSRTETIVLSTHSHVVFSIAGLVLSTSVCQSAAQSFTLTGSISGLDSYMYDVSGDGSFVVGSSRGGPNFGVQWTPVDGIGPLVPGNSLDLVPVGVSQDGSTAVGWRLPTGTRGVGDAAFRYSAVDGLQFLGDLPGGVEQSLAWDTNADGSVVVGEGVSDLGQEAFRWTASTGMVGLGTIGPGILGSFSLAQAISSDGNVIVGASSMTGSFFNVPMRWTEADGMQSLGSIGTAPASGIAKDTNQDGSVIVGSARGPDGGLVAFRWTEDTGMHSIGDLPGGLVYASAAAVSADGSVIGGQSNADDPDGYREAFIWTEDLGIRSLQDVLEHEYGLDLGLGIGSLEEVTGISDDGTVLTGYARFGNRRIGFVATIPAPASVLIPCIAGILISRRRCR